MTPIVLASVRTSIADYLGTLLQVYTLLIFAYIVSSLILSFGVRIPYSRATDVILGFLRDVCEPYLRIFRRFIPPLGPLDLSPIVAIIVLRVVGGVIISILHG
jgi:YggT family protein